MKLTDIARYMFYSTELAGLPPEDFKIENNHVYGRCGAGWTDLYAAQSRADLESYVRGMRDGIGLTEQWMFLSDSPLPWHKKYQWLIENVEADFMPKPKDMYLLEMSRDDNSRVSVRITGYANPLEALVNLAYSNWGPKED